MVAHTDSGAEFVARRLPASHLVAPFQATPSEVLLSVFEARERSPRPSIVFCCDDGRNTRRIAALLEQIGFDPIDAGRSTKREGECLQWMWPEYLHHKYRGLKPVNFQTAFEADWS